MSSLHPAANTGSAPGPVTGHYTTFDPFQRLVRKIAQDLGTAVAIHAKCVTIQAKDVALTRRLHGVYVL
ncbi:hypothetical protein DFH07DRAFT_951755 [Mycena maculata]|uniref:Histone H2A/H2B/H3 domain-containing protein n=1 Tax=Mycena maculata TaxID=230809 RepID=A0AAD7K221_9AGAR|nr:hypothetical protein DFH07DRAFT_951755 [Mycena maculata]